MMKIRFKYKIMRDSHDDLNENLFVLQDDWSIQDEDRLILIDLSNFNNCKYLK